MTFVHAHLIWFIVSASALTLGTGAATAAFVHRRKPTRRPRSRQWRRKR